MFNIKGFRKQPYTLFDRRRAISYVDVIDVIHVIDVSNVIDVMPAAGGILAITRQTIGGTINPSMSSKSSLLPYTVYICFHVIDVIDVIHVMRSVGWYSKSKTYGRIEG